MPDGILAILQQINVIQLFAIGSMIWIFYTRLDRKIAKLEIDLNKKISDLDSSLNKRIFDSENSLNKKIDELETSLSKKIEKLDEKVTDMDRRLCRLEVAFSQKECCMIKDDRKLQRAE